VQVNRELADVLRALAPVGDEAMRALAQLLTTRSFASGDALLQSGERATWCFFVVHGLVRELYIDAAGTEHTRTFLSEGQVTGSLLDLLSGAPSVTYIQAIEPTETLAWRYAELDVLCERFPELNLVLRRFAEALALRKIRREYELLTLAASERYARWRNVHPRLDERVSRRHLASYLGVTPEHLSRLRAALRTSSPRARARRRSR